GIAPHHDAALRIYLVPALLTSDMNDDVAAARIDHRARKARELVEFRHGCPGPAVGVVLPRRRAAPAFAAELDRAEQPVAVDLRHMEEALVGMGGRRAD